MIILTRMDKQEMYLNPDHIISVEETPDTVITLYNGHHFIVKESARVIIDRIMVFRAKIIRRSNGQSSRKYLQRARKSKFHSLTLNRNIVCPGDTASHERSPFHRGEF